MSQRLEEVKVEENKEGEKTSDLKRTFERAGLEIIDSGQFGQVTNDDDETTTPPPVKKVRTEKSGGSHEKKTDRPPKPYPPLVHFFGFLSEGDDHQTMHRVYYPSSKKQTPKVVEAFMEAYDGMTKDRSTYVPGYENNYEGSGLSKMEYLWELFVECIPDADTVQSDLSPKRKAEFERYFGFSPRKDLTDEESPDPGELEDLTEHFVSGPLMFFREGEHVIVLGPIG